MPPPPSCPLAGILASVALVGLQVQIQRCRTSHIPFVQTIEPLAACSTPGGLVTTRLGFGDQTPSTVPFLVQVIQPLHLFFVTTLTQVSRVSIGSGFDTGPLSAAS